MNWQFPRTVACPVCFMPVNTSQCQHTFNQCGQVHFFCGPGCRERFISQHPACHAKSGSVWSRFLDRLALANQDEFGGSGPKCH